MAVAESSRKLEPTLRTLVDEIVEHYNDNYPDAVLFVAQSLAQNESIQRAQIADVESNTIVFDIGGGERYRYEFAEPIAARDGMATRFLGTLHACRRKSPDGELTALEKDMAPNQRVANNAVDSHCIGATHILHPRDYIYR